MKAYQLGPQDCNHWTEKDIDTALGQLKDFIMDCEIGEIFELKIIEMTEDEYRAMPEYTGP